MMNLNNYAENHGKKYIFIFALIDLKRQTKEDTVFVARVKTCILNVLRKRNLFSQSKCSLELKIEMIQKYYKSYLHKKIKLKNFDYNISLANKTFMGI